MRARPAIVIALGLAAAPALAESGQEWLTRMGAALNNASYVGEFVSESAGRTERLAITHRVRDARLPLRFVHRRTTIGANPHPSLLRHLLERLDQVPASLLGKRRQIQAYGLSVVVRGQPQIRSLDRPLDVT